MNNSFSETELSSFNAQYINLNNSAMNNNDSHLPLINIGELADTALRASEYTLSEKNKTIYTNNNMRLQQLEKDIRVFHLYGNACDELLEWLKDDRAYSSINENALINCITAIYEKYAEHGRWSGIQILRTANERCGSLSERGRAIIKRYYNEVCNVSHVRRSSEGSVASNSSANHTAATASPTTSIRSIPPPGAAQSPSSFPSQSPTTSQFPPTQFSGILQNMLETSFVSQPYQQLTPNQQNLLQRQLMLQQQQQFNHRQQQQQQQQTILPQLFQQQQQQQMQISQQQVVNQQQQYQPYQPTQQQVIQQQMLQQKQAQQLAQQKQAQQHAQQQRQAQQQQAQQQAQRQAQQQAQLKAQQLAMLQQQQQYQQQQQQKQQQQQQAMLQQQQLSQALAQQRARQKAMTMARQEYAQQQQQQQQQQQYMQQPHLFHHVPLEQQHTQNVAPPATTSSTGEIVHWTNDLQDQVTRLLNSGPLSPQLTSGPVMLSSSAASTPQPSITMPTSPVRSPASVQRRLSPKAVTTPIAYHRPLHLPSIQIQKPILDKENDTTRFRFSNRYAVKPFRLIHDQQITIKTFFLPKSDIDLLCLNDNILIERDERFPIGFVFTSWYQDGVERKCDWPQTLKVEFNGKILPLQKKSKSTHGSGPPYVGKDYPFDLTKLMRIGENSIKIYQVGCACIYKRFSINAAKRMIESSTIKIEETERMIRNFLGSMEDGDDDEIVILQRSVKLSLKCPISLKKFKIPTRGKNCKHLDCFDLVPYLLINENNNPQWSCPCCNKPAYPDELARDLLLETLLEKLPKNVAEIEFEKDHKNFKITKVDDPDTDDEEEGEEKSTKEKDELTTITVTKKEEYAELPYNVTVIDLISDDEEEEEGEIAAGNQATTTTPHKRPREE